jgi:hypothetical protein
MKKLILVFLFLAGMIATVLLGLYVIAYVFGESDYPGGIAFVPKWIFLFSPLVCLWWKKEVQEFLDSLQKILF